MEKRILAKEVCLNSYVICTVKRRWQFEKSDIKLAVERA